MEKFKFSEQITHMAEKNILFEVIKAFAGGPSTVAGTGGQRTDGLCV